MNTQSCDVGLSVEIHGNERLYKYSRTQSLRDNIRNIVLQFNEEAVDDDGLDPRKQYGLKLIPNKKNKGVVPHYIDDHNVAVDMEDGCSLKLVPCIEDVVEDLFHTKFDGALVLELAQDVVFMQEIARTFKYENLMELVLYGPLNSDALAGALHAIYHLFKNGYIAAFKSNFIVKLTSVVSGATENTLFALNVICQVLLAMGEQHSTSKATILANLQIGSLMRLLNASVQLEALDRSRAFYHRVMRTLNALVAASKDDLRSQIMAELCSDANRDIIYKFMCFCPSIDDTTKREIFVLQSRLLRFAYKECFSNRSSVVSDIDSAHQLGGGDHNNEALPEGDVVEMRLSKAASSPSLSSDASFNYASQHSPLLLKCVEYGKHHYTTYFDSLEKSDYASDEEFFTISQNVLCHLTRLLCIGDKIHARSYFLPVFFAPAEELTASGQKRSIEFIEEVFVKALMLLFRTKAEMRAKTKEDFKILYQVVKKQLKIIFHQQPTDFTDWDIKAREVTYSSVQDILRNERQVRWQHLFNRNRCVMALAQDFSAKNHLLITLQRFNGLHAGHVFRNIHHKSKVSHFFLQLMPNNTKFLYYDCNTLGQVLPKAPTVIHVGSIKHIIVGSRCPLVMNGFVHEANKDCAFSLEYDGPDKTFVHCYFEDVAMASLWKDGVHLLIGQYDLVVQKENYRRDLKLLNEMDCAVQLIELQDVEIPNEPPPLPPFLPNADC